MSQVEEFVKIVEGVKDHDVKVVIVTGKPVSAKNLIQRFSGKRNHCRNRRIRHKPPRLIFFLCRSLCGKHHAGTETVR